MALSVAVVTRSSSTTHMGARTGIATAETSCRWSGTALNEGVESDSVRLSGLWCP